MRGSKGAPSRTPAPPAVPLGFLLLARMTVGHGANHEHYDAAFGRAYALARVTLDKLAAGTLPRHELPDFGCLCCDELVTPDLRRAQQAVKRVLAVHDAEFDVDIDAEFGHAQVMATDRGFQFGLAAAYCLLEELKGSGGVR